ncbi:acyltransferase family protein [Clostridium chromiireducens]|uniref:Acyltransferase family protein n=2 Tax=Clostridium chromiireducens TaxID=225345 RepID=A0A1V4IHQ2_9CLOT|nr:acyltransferase family protein [Clostridium chromiireducens]
MRKRVFYLDFIRAISVMLIITYHFNVQIGLHNINTKYVMIQNFANENIGSIGITLFIMISGMALMLNYKDNLDMELFIKKRITTLYPIYWIGYILTFIILAIIIRGIPVSAEGWSFVFTIVGMDGFLYYIVPNFYLIGEWFFGFIIILYLIFPIARILLLKYPKRTLGIVIIVYIFLTSHYGRLFQIDVVRNPLIRLLDFMFGMSLAVYMKEIKSYQFLVGIIGLIILLGVPLNISHIYIAFLAGALVFICLIYISKYIRLESVRKLISFISKYSFAAILTHHNIIAQILNRFNNTQISIQCTYLLYIVVLMITFLAAFCLFELTIKIKSMSNFSRNGIN